MKRWLSLLLAILLLAVFGVFAVASGESEEKKQAGGSVDNAESVASAGADNTELGDYLVDIKSCRIAKDYEGKPVVIVTYGFTNNGENTTSFTVAISDKVFQNGVGLNKAFILDDSAQYSSDNQMRDLQTGASLDVEVAYVLNDTTSDIVVEVSELISLNDAKLTATFSITQ